MSVRIFDNNVLDLDVVANFSFSSEQTSFPLINAFNFNRRSKVWRTDGYHEITASNNEILFRESVGPYLTATVAAANYSSRTALFSAIKTAMEAVGGNTYTIEEDASTFRTKITTSGGYLDIDWPSSSMASVLGFSTAVIDTGAVSYVADLLKIHTGEYLELDFGISTLPTAFALIGRRNDPIKITPSATLTLLGNETNTFTSPTASITLDYDDEVICSVNSAGLWPEALRYARLEITDASNTNGYIEIGALFLGTFFEGTRGKAQFPFLLSPIDRSTNILSEGGQSFSDIREKSESFSVDWFGLTVAEKEQIDDLFLALGVSKPFFVQFDGNPDLGFSGRKEKYVRYVKFSEAPTFELVSVKNFTCTMKFTEEL